MRSPLQDSEASKTENPEIWIAAKRKLKSEMLMEALTLLLAIPYYWMIAYISGIDRDQYASLISEFLCVLFLAYIILTGLLIIICIFTFIDDLFSYNYKIMEYVRKIISGE